MFDFDEDSDETQYQLTPLALLYLRYGESQAHAILAVLTTYMRKLSDDPSLIPAMLLEDGKLVFRLVKIDIDPLDEEIIFEED